MSSSPPVAPNITPVGSSRQDDLDLIRIDADVAALAKEFIRQRRSLAEITVHAREQVQGETDGQGEAAEQALGFRLGTYVCADFVLKKQDKFDEAIRRGGEDVVA